MEWSIVITTCSIEKSLLSMVVYDLKRNGWDNIIIYSEPNSNVNESVRVVQRDVLYGCWTNWICALYDMYSLYNKSEVIAIFEDDVTLSTNMKIYLEHIIPSLANFGALSLYTPSHQQKKHKGLHCLHDESYRGGKMWGTQAIIFTRESLSRFLTSKNVIEHRKWDTGKDNKNRDSAIGIWAKQNGERIFYHTPSLVQHIGNDSSINHEYHCADDFVGKEFDCLNLLKEKIPVVITPSEVYFL